MRNKVNQDTCDVVRNLTNNGMSIKRISSAVNIGRSTIDRIKISKYDVNAYMALGRKYSATKNSKGTNTESTTTRTVYTPIEMTNNVPTLHDDTTLTVDGAKYHVRNALMHLTKANELLMK